MSKAKQKTGGKKRRQPESSREARQRASVILEVLAGTMTPTSAAEVLGCSPARYYGIEAQALKGLVTGCEPKPVGYVRTPERELEALRKQHAKLERECARYQSLCRAAQRTAGLSAAKVERAKKSPGKRKRKPTVRALKLAGQLREGAAPPPEKGKRDESRKTD
jgi:hypothetical protein